MDGLAAESKKEANSNFNQQRKQQSTAENRENGEEEGSRQGRRAQGGIGLTCVRQGMHAQRFAQAKAKRVDGQ
jgi:hypothetical protein